MHGTTSSRRRDILLGGGAAGLALCTPWIAKGAPKYKLRYAITRRSTDSLAVRAAEAIKRINEESDNELEVLFFPGGQLGSDTDGLSQVRSGALDLFGTSSVLISTVVPASAVGGVGFAFQSYDQVWKAMDGDLGSHIRSQMPSAGIIGLPRMWDYGFRNLTATSKPIENPTSLNGFKIRVPPGPLWASLFRVFGAVPTTLNLGEVYSALRTGVIDGTDLPVLAMADFKLEEIQKYISRTSHMWDGQWILANRRMWEGLPPKLSQLIETHMSAAALNQRKDVEKLELEALAQFKSAGGTVVNVQPSEFKSKLQGSNFYKEWKGKLGDHAWSLLERYAGPLG